MANQDVHIAYRALRDFLPALIDKCHPEKIISFGCLHESRSASGCFVSNGVADTFHYFLLLVIPDNNTLLMNELQDYVNIHFFRGKITLVTQSQEAIGIALSKGKTFYNEILRNGLVLYQVDGLLLDIPVLPDIDHAVVLSTAERVYHSRRSMAQGFLRSAADCLKNGFYNNTLFLLHQAMEQACIQVIRIHIGYRAEIHNPGRMLDLSRCFSDKLAALFHRKTARQKELFEMLKDGFIATRYHTCVEVSKENAYELYEQVSALVDAAETLSVKKISQLTVRAQQAAMHITDYSPGLPAHSG